MKKVLFPFIVLMIFSFQLFPKDTVPKQKNLLSKNKIDNAKRDSKSNSDKSAKKQEPLKYTNKKVDSSNKEDSFYAGISLSMISASGFSFQYRFLPNQRIKISGLLAHPLNYSVYGLEWQYDLKKRERYRIYYLLGGGISSNFFSSDEDGELSAGFGVGLDLFCSKHFSFNLDLGLSYNKCSSDYEKTTTLNLAFGLGLNYGF